MARGPSLEGMRDLLRVLRALERPGLEAAVAANGRGAGPANPELGVLGFEDLAELTVDEHPAGTREGREPRGDVDHRTEHVAHSGDHVAVRQPDAQLREAVVPFAALGELQPDPRGVDRVVATEEHLVDARLDERALYA